MKNCFFRFPVHDSNSSLFSVENVVRAPANPDTSKSFHSIGISNPTRMPISKEPVKFTTNVPYGKLPSTFDFPEMIDRMTAPINPPAPIITSSTAVISLPPSTLSSCLQFRTLAHQSYCQQYTRAPALNCCSEIGSMSPC